MPTIAYFYGIAIEMFFKDHNPPHIHARYGGARALIRLSDGQIMSGQLPPNARRMVESWVLSRREELERNWQRARARQQLEKVRGPDDDE
jgi:hypothetical protein